MLSYLPFVGSWFVGPTLTEPQRVSYFSSYGLLDTAGTPAAPSSWWQSLIVGARTVGFVG